jgi:hypothetical protein
MHGLAGESAMKPATRPGERRFSAVKLMYTHNGREMSMERWIEAMQREAIEKGMQAYEEKVRGVASSIVDRFRSRWRRAGARGRYNIWARSPMSRALSWRHPR